MSKQIVSFFTLSVMSLFLFLPNAFAQAPSGKNLNEPELRQVVDQLEAWMNEYEETANQIIALLEQDELSPEDEERLEELESRLRALEFQFFKLGEDVQAEVSKLKEGPEKDELQERLSHMIDRYQQKKAELHRARHPS